jgi:hypothetical protein
MLINKYLIYLFFFKILKKKEKSSLIENLF